MLKKYYLWIRAEGSKFYQPTGSLHGYNSIDELKSDSGNKIALELYKDYCILEALPVENHVPHNLNEIVNLKFTVEKVFFNEKIGKLQITYRHLRTGKIFRLEQEIDKLGDV